MQVDNQSEQSMSETPEKETIRNIKLPIPKRSTYYSIANGSIDLSADCTFDDIEIIKAPAEVEVKQLRYKYVEFITGMCRCFVKNKKPSVEPDRSVQYQVE